MAARLGRDITRVQIPHRRPSFSSGYIVNLGDGRAWNSEVVGSNPTTQTKTIQGIMKWYHPTFGAWKPKFDSWYPDQHNTKQKAQHGIFSIQFNHDYGNVISKPC